MQSSSPPWRAFDAPPASVSDPGTGTGPASASGQAAGGTSQLNGPSVFRRLGATPGIAVAAVFLAIIVGGLAVLMAMSGMSDVAVAGPEDGFGAFATVAPGADLVVDVAGAVVTPGVYRLPPGSRVRDAVNAAGGFSPRVDAERVGTELNLAAAVADGAEIRVPSRDDPAPADPGGGGAGGPGTGGGAGSALINLNSATQAELESLPGIGPVGAGKILESRASAPFANVDELRDRGLVGEKTFEKIKPLVTVG